MDPFSKEVWLYLGIAYLGVSLCLFVLGRLSPSEWDNPYPCIEEPEELENQFTINNSLWFTTGALLQQGSEIAPKYYHKILQIICMNYFSISQSPEHTHNISYLVVFYADHGILIHCELSCVSDHRKPVQFN